MDDDGNYKDIKPGCAFSHLPDEAGLPNQPFHFYYQKGTVAKTLIYFNGDGTCWNGATCLTSLTIPVTPTTRPAYNPSITDENNPEALGGIMDFTRTDNPLKDWNMVFIPYCTGDAHIASSAGPYSAFMNYTVFTRKEQKFYCCLILDTVFEPGGPWETERTLARWIPGISNISSYNALNFFTNVTAGIERHFANSKFAYVTTAWNGIQMLFLNIMRQTDQGQNNPGQWFNLTPVTAVERNLRMPGHTQCQCLDQLWREILYCCRNRSRNVTGVFAPGIFYSEKSADGVFLSSWVNWLVTDDKKIRWPI